MVMMSTITNIAAYKFATLVNLKQLRSQLITQTRAWGLKGTILLSHEGINLFVAGGREEVELLLAELREVPGLEGLETKVSESDHQPFNRMLVRIKKEIISFGEEGIDPARYTSKKLPPLELKQWLDEGRNIVLLDTRNDYEVKLGTFKNALTIPLDHFREFPDAVRKLPADLKEKQIVMFCTGGIRCEKAGPFMEQEGFQNVYQLEGGILRYFEECGGDHYDGECFVFDHRVGVNAALHETETDQCFACQTPLTAAEQEDPRFVKGRSCPYCFVTDEEQMARSIAERHAAIEKVITPLPGSVAYDNHRPIDVPAAFDGYKLLDFLQSLLRHVPVEGWRELCEGGLFLNSELQAVGTDHVVRAGERYFHLERETCEPDVDAHIRILHEDEAIIVLHKPAPIPMHPSGRFNRNTVQYILRKVYQPQSPRPGHRLDANTTGIAVFARTRHFAGILQPQFERGEVDKLYLARIQGHPPTDQFSCSAPISAIAGNLGSREIDEENGLASHTDFEVLKRFPDSTALLSVVPVTGRTNQIRLHLWELGWPIVGDELYLPDHQVGTTQTHALHTSTLCLFARHITFTHPLTKQRVSFEAEIPEWARDVV
jgi:UPF0176 protein